MKADDICAKYSESSVGLNLRMMVDDDNGITSSFVLIEGGGRALRMLAELLFALSDEANGEGFYLSPFGPGLYHFSKDSEMGIYIHHKE